MLLKKKPLQVKKSESKRCLWCSVTFFPTEPMVRWRWSRCRNMSPSKNHPPSDSFIFNSNLTFDIPAITEYPTASSWMILFMVRECLLSSAEMVYLWLGEMSLESRCHFTFTPGFSVSVSNMTLAPISAVWDFGFLLKAETEGLREGQKERMNLQNLHLKLFHLKASGL